MENKIALFSMMREEPHDILDKRLEALAKLSKDSYDVNWIMESFDERDEQGFGVLNNLADNNVNICQYGVLTTFEQLALKQADEGIVICDLFEAMTQYKLIAHWGKLSLLHQTFTNSGVFVYVPAGKKIDVMCYFVQDNSVDEIMVKSVLIVKEQNAKVRFHHVDFAFGDNKNFTSLEIIEINVIA